MVIGNQLQLLEFVERPNWKTILLELIYTRKLDPWDIDLDVLAKGFMERIKDMESLDLYIPGNIILALSIILKFKAERLNEEEDEEYIEALPLRPESPVLAGMPKKRPVTLQELTEAIERALKKYTQPKRKGINRKVEEEIVLALPQEERGINTEEEMEELKKRMLEKVDEYGLVNLTDILRRVENERKKVRFLIYSASMELKGEVELLQERPFSNLLAKVVM